MTQDEFREELQMALSGNQDAMVKVALAYQAGDGTTVLLGHQAAQVPDVRVSPLHQPVM
jgi:hypothetical protein